MQFDKVNTLKLLEDMKYVYLNQKEAIKPETLCTEESIKAEKIYQERVITWTNILQEQQKSYNKTIADLQNEFEQLTLDSITLAKNQLSEAKNIVEETNSETQNGKQQIDKLGKNVAAVTEAATNLNQDFTGYKEILRKKE